MFNDALFFSGHLEIVRGRNAHPGRHWLRQGHSRAEVYAGNPKLPPGAVEAVERWAAASIGPGWRERMGLEPDEIR